MKDKIQAVILTFDDGSTAKFTGRAVCEESDTKTIRDIKFTRPIDLPEGCKFEEIEK